MRKVAALLIVTIVLCSCAPQQETPSIQVEPQPSKPAQPPKTVKFRPVANPPAMTFIHACYVYSHKLQSRWMLEQIRFDQFNVLYLIAAPKWTAAEFDDSTAWNRYVVSDLYPASDSGMALAPDFIDLAHQYKVKVMLCLQDRQFLAVASNPRKQKNFIMVMTAIVKKYGYDGIEIDWENDFDMALHAELMAGLRRGLDAMGGEKHYYLSTALIAGQRYKPAMAVSLSRSVDWINVMTYDLGGALYGNTPTHNASLPSMKKYLDNWSVFGHNKICVGLAGYGYRYHNIAPGRKSTVPLRQIGQSVHYNQLESMLSSGWKESYDTKAEAPYYFSPDGRSFATLDNSRSISRKMDTIMAGRYRGVFWWEFHSDIVMPTTNDQWIHHLLIDPVESRIRGLSAGFRSYGIAP